ncbi:transcriptional regulator, GntR family [Rubrobacter radiotolerans DSM 5868]|nr:transcriptional regulator, GntR family [Rubrobacter radiotolerans DSM 5868]
MRRPARGGERGRTTALERLRAMILTGEYRPDERLVEEQLAERLGVSRTPVRQALTMLEAEGLVEIAPNRGAVVCSFSAEDVWDIYDLRAELEGYAARRAASRVTVEDLALLAGLVAEQEEIGTGPERSEEVRRLVAVNQRFHGRIVEASGNRRLARLIQRTVQVPLVFKAFYWYTPKEKAVSDHYHRQILRALEQGDGLRAEIVMREHVYEGRDFVIKALEEDGKSREEQA